MLARLRSHSLARKVGRQVVAKIDLFPRRGAANDEQSSEEDMREIRFHAGL